MKPLEKLRLLVRLIAILPFILFYIIGEWWRGRKGLVDVEEYE